MTRVVLTASARTVIEQSAGDACQEDLACLIIFDFIQTAFSASITKRFPFRFGHVL
jgi:hypothetical protein